jgi:DNA invertase Pin-like site-specific DNA recombinase
MDVLHAGDELVVVKLDRLGRSTRDVFNLVHELEAKGETAALILRHYRAVNNELQPLLRLK